MKSRLQLKSIMSMLFIGVVIVPLLIISVVAVSFTSSYMTDMMTEHNQHIIKNLRLNIESFFEEPKRDMKALRDLIHLNNGDIDEAVIKSFFENQRMLHHLLFIDELGEVTRTFPETDDVLGFDYSREHAFQEVHNGKPEAWSKTYVDSRENKVSINYALPVNDDVLLGVIHLDIIEDLFKKTIEDEDILVGITDYSGVYILHTDYQNVEQRVTDPYVLGKPLNYEKVRYNSGDYYATSIEAGYQGWKIIIYEPAAQSESRLRIFGIYLTLIILALVIISIFIGKKTIHMVFDKLNEVVAETKKIAQGQYAVDAKISPFVEFNEISSNFSYMADEVRLREEQIINQSNEIEMMNRELESRVIDRTNELFQTNQELEITLDNLKRTQDQLIESEKLASLGDLVAGLAHEINTPLGIILTIITYLEETTKKVKKQYDSGLLKKADFEQHLESTLESERLIFENVNRAIELISSFKLISAEQRNVEKRMINLREFLENIIKSLEPQLKKSSIQMRLTCPEHVEIETIPLTLYQIIINLIMNTKIHAYEEFGGYVDIGVTLEKNRVLIILEDYGVGIPKEYLKKIFDPFFTTKRGSGGTGLGLNIVYNSVKQNLQGDILCHSEVGSGTQFVIDLPIHLE